MSDEEQVPVKVEFRSKAKKQFRKRIKSEDEDKPDDDTLSKLEETKEKQKLRIKPNGVNILTLAVGKKVTVEEEVTNKDLFNAKSGGMVNMQALKSGKIKPIDDAYDTGIGTQFSAETNKRDEDEEMMKYIEEQLSKKKGVTKDPTGEPEAEPSHKYLSPEEAALLSLPAHLSQTSSQRSEEMLSNQMLSGIPEVDLGIEAKIKNIEATEDAKIKFLQEQQRKKDLPSHFVPSNMAVNFMQHNRFKIDQPVQQKRRYMEVQQRRSGDDKVPKKATDDYHFDKFKKQYRRH